MARKRTNNGSHAVRPIRNFFYAIYSLLNAVAFTSFFYHLYLVDRSGTDTAVMIASGAVAVIGLFVGVLKPLFSK